MLVEHENIPTCQAERYDVGLYNILSWTFENDLERSDRWYQFSHEWPEFQGDVDSRLKHLRTLFESGTFIQEYGSCDSPEQFKRTKLYDIITASPHAFIITFRHMLRSDESDGGYRWHKNGSYIGERHLEGYEYFKDEPNVDEIYQFHVYRRKQPL